jgi:protoporphyrinogen oxidase
MATMKELALQASDDAFKEAVKATVSALLTSLILANSDEERAASTARHKTGLSRCKEVHEANLAAIQEVFG